MMESVRTVRVVLNATSWLLLIDYSDVFSYEDSNIGLTKVVCHEIS